MLCMYFTHNAKKTWLPQRLHNNETSDRQLHIGQKCMSTASNVQMVTLLLQYNDTYQNLITKSCSVITWGNTVKCSCSKTPSAILYNKNDHEGKQKL